jgi:hypothetical protein
MADNDKTGVATNAPVVALGEQPESPNSSPLGVYAPFPYSSEPFAEISPEAKAALMALDTICTKTDIAARRLEVEQAWEALHFDRGYQHLLRGRQGGWELPGQSTGFGARAQQNTAGIYDTNVYGSKGDIIVAALSREVPKQEFFPMNPDYGPDIIAAEEAENFKLIWARNNNLHALLVDCARIFWNEDRVLLWTRYELNGQKYGFEEDQDQNAPTTPEDIFNPPPAKEDGQEGLEDVIDADTAPAAEEGAEPDGSVVSSTLAETGGAKKPLGREVTTAHGKLDHKVPIGVDCLSEMQFVQLMFDLDVAVVRGMFPWIADKVQVGGDGNSESQLDRIARENVRQAVLGAYVTGDSLSRHTTVKFTWLRPSMFLDQSVDDAVKAELLEAFPNGCMMGRAGQEFAFARNESMDKHIAIAHPSSGKGQNRRAMGASLISIQKRINDWIDIMDDFFKRTIPKKWMNADAFDMEALKSQPNLPGSIGPFTPQPGLTNESQYIMVEPTPQPQAALPEFIRWFITSLSEEISGALPSLFGAATNTETVGGIEIQRDQALQRVGCPWNNIQDLFAEAALQAVGCAKDCRDGKQISQNVPGAGSNGEARTVSVNTSNLAGNVLCYAESNPAFPESWAQREAKLTQMIDASTQNQAIQQWLFSPANLPILADGMRMKAFKVPGASSVAKQKMEFETLLRSGPMPNPQLAKLQQAAQEATDGMKSHAMQLEDPNTPPEQKAQLQQELQQGAPMLQQLGQAIQQLSQSTPLVSTVPVAQDESELHTIEADACFQWMNSSEGQKFKNGTQQMKMAYANIHLHWQEHVAMAKKIAAANAPPDKPPSESLSAAIDKLPTNVAIQALAKMGINATPADYDTHQKEQLQLKVAGKAIPEALKQDGEKPKPKQQTPPGVAPGV